VAPKREESAIPAPVIVPLEPAAPPQAVAAPVPPAEPGAPVRRFVRVFDQQAQPVAEHHATDPSAAERRLGPEQLTILRARYAEILARIAARGGDPARAEALREQAERVNPDSWVTDEEVAAGMDVVEPVLADLHQQVGRRRRRRRRGGRGRRPDPLTDGTTGAPITADSHAGESPALDGPDEASDEEDDGPDE
jgi:hypothetical protein